MGKRSAGMAARVAERSQFWERELAEKRFVVFGLAGTVVCEERGRRRADRAVFRRNGLAELVGRDWGGQLTRGAENRGSAEKSTQTGCGG